MPGRVTQKGDTIYLNIGQRWFQYNERSLLGSGAMGTVYKGYDCNSGEPVAIKRVMDRYANNPEIRRRAHQEAELMFRHPNLVEMLGCCEVAPNRGPIFIVSNFVQGENIDQFINTHVRSLPNVEKRICELFFPVLDALAYIHQKGIIHMDIKPSNIMMEQGKNVRLMDLGIADVTDTVNTATSGMMGTPKYAAPEQFSDEKRDSQLTAATDIYEAGVTLYELLTMTNPFSASTVLEAKELHRELILEKKPMMSDAVYQVIRKATAIYPSDRYQNASQMKMALKTALTVPEPKSNWMPWLIAGIVGVAVIVLLLIFLL
jgi:serine/threonine-protein kinase